jgi:hypothetical protein
MYLVTAGSYSDYRVLGVYDTPEKAERARVLYDADDVEEFQLNEMPETPPGLLPWRVVMTRDGAAYLCVRESAPIEPSKELRAYGGGKMTGTVYAADEKHAVKIINEMRIQALALGRWPQEPPEQRTWAPSHRYELKDTKTSLELLAEMMAEPDPVKRSAIDERRLRAMESEMVKVKK